MVYYSRYSSIGSFPNKTKTDKAFSLHSGLISLHSGLMFWHLSHAPHRFLHVGVLFLRPLLAQHPSRDFRTPPFPSSICLEPWSRCHWPVSFAIFWIKLMQCLALEFKSYHVWQKIWAAQKIWFRFAVGFMKCPFSLVETFTKEPLSFKRWVLWKFMDQIELNWLGFCSLSPWWHLRQIRTDKAPEKVIKSLAASGSIEIGGVALHLCMCLGFNS